MEDLRKRATQMEIEIALLRKEKMAWNTFLESNEGNQRPEEISRDLHRERLAHKVAQDHVQVLETEISEIRTRLRSAEEIAHTVNAEVQGKQEQLTKLERRYERVERQKTLAQREVEFLKEQLKTYDSEETVFLSGAVDAQKLARIEKLEKLVVQYKSELDRISKEGPLPGVTAEIGKRKRPDLTEEDEESKRKIRILQNGSPIHHISNLRLDEISSV
jgi:mitotic spindle assembly checkpoint protein MAD1